MNIQPKINPQNGPFPPPAVPAHWPPLQRAKTLIGLSRRPLALEDVLTLIETRQIVWAWDIARPGANRPEIRIWRESLLGYLAHEGGAAPQNGGLSLRQIIEAILPGPAALGPRSATVNGRELQRRFQCSRTHLAGLIADGELARVGPARPGISPVILWQSVFEFLKRRRLPL